MDEGESLKVKKFINLRVVLAATGSALLISFLAIYLCSCSMAHSAELRLAKDVGAFSYSVGLGIESALIDIKHAQEDKSK